MLIFCVFKHTHILMMFIDDQVHACNHNFLEVETGDSQIPASLGYYSELEASLRYKTNYLTKKKPKTINHTHTHTEKVFT